MYICIEDARHERATNVLGNQSSQLTAARQAVKMAKNDLRAHQKEEQKKKLAANMKRRRTWLRNAKMHAANKNRRQSQRQSHYNSGSLQAQHVKSEHAYQTWKKPKN